MTDPTRVLWIFGAEIFIVAPVILFLGQRSLDKRWKRRFPEDPPSPAGDPISWGLQYIARRYPFLYHHEKDPDA